MSAIKLQDVIDQHLKNHANLSEERFKWSNFHFRFKSALTGKNHLNQLQRQTAKAGLAWLELHVSKTDSINKEIRIEILARKQSNAHLSESLGFITMLLWFVSFVGLGSILNANLNFELAIFSSFSLVGVVIALFLAIIIRSQILENEYVIFLLEQFMTLK